MANDGPLFAWCKRERERLQMQREMLHSGRFRIFEKDEAGQRDISDQHIAQIASNITELDRIIAEYERAEYERTGTTGWREPLPS